jgi:hypothetical protein
MSKDIGVPAGAAPIVSKAQLLLQLALRCETEEPSLLLRCDIAKALGWREVEHDCHIRYVDPAGKMWWATEMPDWPGSLDAAVTLVPKVLLWRVGEWHNAARARVGDIFTEGKTTARALCAASLRARAAQEDVATPSASHRGCSGAGEGSK